MTLVVVDASTVGAALLDSGPDGVWAEAVLTGGDLVAPHLLPVEVASILRRAVATGRLTEESGAVAHAQLVRMPVDLWPYAPLAERVWALRPNVTTYDAWYVALAETVDAPLATLDARLARAPGPRCRFLTAPESD